MWVSMMGHVRVNASRQGLVLAQHMRGKVSGKCRANAGQMAACGACAWGANSACAIGLSAANCQQWPVGDWQMIVESVLQAVNVVNAVVACRA